MIKKRILILLLTLVLLPAITFGAVGLCAGLNFNSIAVEQGSTSWGALTTWRVGGSFSWKLSNQLALQPELYLSHSGTKTSMQILGETINVTEKYSYIEMPVLLSYNVLSFKRTRLNLLAGLYMGFNIKAEQEINGLDGQYRDSIRDSISKTDFGWVVGVGLVQPMGKGGVTVDLRYSGGFSNINQPNATSPVIHNRMFQVILGYRLGH